MIDQVGAKISSDRLRDLDGRKMGSTLSKCAPHQRRDRDAAGLFAVEEGFDLSVSLHPLGKTGPASTLAGAEHRPHQWKNTGRLDQHPCRMIRQMLVIQFP